MDGAFTVQPSTRPAPPARMASASSRQSPPASAEAVRVISLSPTFARPGAFTEVEIALGKIGETETTGERGGEQQACVVHEAVVVEGDVYPVSVSVAPGNRPLVVLLGEHRADEPDDRGAVGEDADHAG